MEQQCVCVMQVQDMLCDATAPKDKRKHVLNQLYLLVHSAPEAFQVLPWYNGSTVLTISLNPAVGNRHNTRKEVKRICDGEIMRLHHQEGCVSFLMCASYHDWS